MARFFILLMAWIVPSFSLFATEVESYGSESFSFFEDSSKKGIKRSYPYHNKENIPPKKKNGENTSSKKTSKEKPCGAISPKRHKILEEKGLTSTQIKTASALNQSLRTGETLKPSSDMPSNLIKTYKQERPRQIKNPELFPEDIIDPAAFRVQEGITREDLRRLKKTKGLVIQSPPRKAFHDPGTYFTEEELKEQRKKRHAALKKMNESGSSSGKDCFDLEKRTFEPFALWMKEQKENILLKDAKKLDQQAINLALYDFVKKAFKKGDYRYFVLEEEGYLCLYPIHISLTWKNEVGTNDYFMEQGYNPIDTQGDSFEWHHVTRCDALTEHDKKSPWSKAYKKLQKTEDISTMPLKKLFKNLCVVVLMTLKGHDISSLHPQKEFCSLSFLRDDRLFSKIRGEMNKEVHERIKDSSRKKK